MPTGFAFLFPVLNQEKGTYSSMEKYIKIAADSINLKAFIFDLGVIVHGKAQFL